MRKVLFITFLTLSFANLFAQSELTVVKGETMDGKKIRIDYYKGKSKDLIEKIEYEVIDELNARIAEYQKTIREYSKSVDNLRNDNKKSENTINSLNKKIIALNDSIGIMERRCKEHLTILEGYNVQIQHYQFQNDSLNDASNNNDLKLLSVIDSLGQVNNSLRLEIARYNDELSKLGDDLGKAEVDEMELPQKSSHSLGIDFGFGFALFNNTNLENDFWSKETCTNQHISVYFQTKRLVKSFPLSVGIGIGFDRMSLKAHFNYYSETIENVTDNDGDKYNLTRDYYNVKEITSLSYISIPIFVAVGQPYANKVSVYGKLTIVPMLNISKNATASGTYTSTGYYPQWDVTLHDVPELGFNTDAPCYNDDADMNVNSFILCGSLSAGVYYPLCNLNKNTEGSSFIFKGGIRLDYTLMSVAGKSSKDDISNANYHLGVYNSIENTKVFSPIIEIGLIYLLKK